MTAFEIPPRDIIQQFHCVQSAVVNFKSQLTALTIRHAMLSSSDNSPHYWKHWRIYRKIISPFQISESNVGHHSKQQRINHWNKLPTTNTFNASPNDQNFIWIYSSYTETQPNGIIRVNMIGEIMYTHFILSTHDDDWYFLLDIRSSRARGGELHNLPHLQGLSHSHIDTTGYHSRYLTIT